VKNTLKAIDTREDIVQLVNRFYAKIRADELLGPIFNRHIAKGKWPEHLSKLADFWETNLFGTPKFKGSPSVKHINVDRNLGNTIEQAHFEKWLKLWSETIDEMYEGERAIKAKTSARIMAKGQFLVIAKNRP